MMLCYPVIYVYQSSRNRQISDTQTFRVFMVPRYSFIHGTQIWYAFMVPRYVCIHDTQILIKLLVPIHVTYVDSQIVYVKLKPNYFPPYLLPFHSFFTSIYLINSMSFPSTPELTQTSQQNLANSKEARDRRIVDAARQGLKAVENNDELYEWYKMELQQIVSGAAEKVVSLENRDGNRSGLRFGESG